MMTTAESADIVVTILVVSVVVVADMLAGRDLARRNRRAGRG